ncbi:MAG: hypothetical protein ACPL3S_00695 [Halothiobacillaceae bacterium]
MKSVCPRLVEERAVFGRLSPNAVDTLLGRINSLDYISHGRNKGISSVLPIFNHRLGCRSPYLIHDYCYYHECHFLHANPQIKDEAGKNPQLLVAGFVAIDKCVKRQKEEEMSLLTRQQAADLMDVPIPWVDAFLEVGALKQYEGPDGEILIDADEILVKRFAATRYESASLAHIRSMLKKFGLSSSAASGS